MFFLYGNEGCWSFDAGSLHAQGLKPYWQHNYLHENSIARELWALGHFYDTASGLCDKRKLYSQTTPISPKQIAALGFNVHNVK